MWETLAACRDPPGTPPVRYLEYIVRYGGVPGGSQHAAYRVTHKYITSDARCDDSEATTRLVSIKALADEQQH